MKNTFSRRFRWVVWVVLFVMAFMPVLLLLTIVDVWLTLILLDGSHVLEGLVPFFLGVSAPALIAELTVLLTSRWKLASGAEFKSVMGDYIILQFTTSCGELRQSSIGKTLTTFSCKSSLSA